MTDEDAPDDVLRERAAESRILLWFLLEANRWLVTGVAFVGVLIAIVAIGYLFPGAETALRSGDSVDTLFQALLAATITGVTLVVSLNQLVLSQELGAVGDQRERMEEAMSFRNDAAEAIDAPVSPARPAQFLRALVDVSGDRGRALRSAVPADGSDRWEAVDVLTDSLIENADRVAGNLDNARFGEFEVISSALNFNYSWKVYSARRILAAYGDELDDQATEAIESLLEVLQLFGPAREHFKTLYFQWELIDLSRGILTAAFPAFITSAAFVAFVDLSTYSIVVFDVQTAIPLVALGVSISLLPFFVLFAFVIRIATVTKHTLSIGPFILRETEAAAEVDW